jgi:glycosyltransferase A (GT-A) superfamily protein (DUF2064 family)
LADVLSRPYPAVATKYLYLAGAVESVPQQGDSFSPTQLIGDEHAKIRSIAERHNWRARCQQGEGLGVRMRHAAAGVLREHAACLVLGTDAPGLPLNDLCVPLESDRPVLVTPSNDGGYVAMRVSREGLALFSAEVSWGTSDVMSQTLALAASENIAVRVLDPWFDLDTVADIERELVKCSDERRTRLEASAPRTMRFVRQIFGKHRGTTGTEEPEVG